MRITFIQTGGTIDKDYPRKSGGWAFEFGAPAMNRLLEKLDPSFEYEVLTAFQKDSQEITPEDRQKLLDLVFAQENKRIVITHGTDTMLETAELLSRHVIDKTVVITGAMRPERFSNSDAPLNLGCAIAAATLMESGVFIAMHGIVKPHDEIRRDTDTGKFY
jgi:L-asparaginase